MGEGVRLERLLFQFSRGGFAVDRLVYRLFAASGVAYVALVVLGNDILGGNSQAPDPGAPRAAIAAWLAVQGAPTLKDWASLYSEGLGLLLLLVFAAMLAATVRRAEGEGGPVAMTVLVAGATSAAIKLISIPIALAALYRAPQGIDIQVGAALIDINNFCFILTWAVDGVMLAALAIGGLRYKALPAWLAWFTAVVAVALLAAPALIAGPGFLAMLLFLVWAVISSITLVLRPAALVAASATS
jgi:hypothetical protein